MYSIISNMISSGYQISTTTRSTPFRYSIVHEKRQNFLRLYIGGGRYDEMILHKSRLSSTLLCFRLALILLLLHDPAEAVAVVVVVALAWLDDWWALVLGLSMRTTRAPGSLDRTLQSGIENPTISNTIIIIIKNSADLSLAFPIIPHTCMEKTNEILHSVPHPLLLKNCRYFCVSFGEIFRSVSTLNTFHRTGETTTTTHDILLQIHTCTVLGIKKKLPCS